MFSSGDVDWHSHSEDQHELSQSARVEIHSVTPAALSLGLPQGGNSLPYP